jgi:hypothetical protein
MNFTIKICLISGLVLISEYVQINNVYLFINEYVPFLIILSSEFVVVFS